MNFAINSSLRLQIPWSKTTKEEFTHEKLQEIMKTYLTLKRVHKKKMTRRCDREKMDKCKTYFAKQVDADMTDMKKEYV